MARIEPVEDEGTRSPNVQKARGRGRKPNSNHGNASITSLQCWPDSNTSHYGKLEASTHADPDQTERGRAVAGSTRVGRTAAPGCRRLRSGARLFVWIG